MQTPRTTLRLATADDIEFLTDVSIEVTRDQGRLPTDFDEAEWRAGFADWTAEQIRGEIPDSTTYVIELGGERIGRLRVVRTTTFIELAGLQIAPAYQSHGIGTRIIRDLIEESRADGVVFELRVEKDNGRARALYEQLGMVWDSDTDTEHRLVLPRP